jgi:hypothetical protein
MGTLIAIHTIFFCESNYVEYDRHITGTFQSTRFFDRMNNSEEKELSFASFHALVEKKSQND